MRRYLGTNIIKRPTIWLFLFFFCLLLLFLGGLTSECNREKDIWMRINYSQMPRGTKCPHSHNTKQQKGGDICMYIKKESKKED